MRRTRMTAGALLSVGALLGCGKRGPGDTRVEHPAARVSESALAKSKIPGASAVGRALQIADSAAARRRREDSISQERP